MAKHFKDEITVSIDYSIECLKLTLNKNVDIFNTNDIKHIERKIEEFRKHRKLYVKNMKNDAKKTSNTSFFLNIKKTIDILNSI
jgi:acetolactate synthase regulatory subunit